MTEFHADHAIPVGAAAGRPTLSWRAINALTAELGPGWTLADVYEAGPLALLRLPNIGRATIRQIAAVLEAAGFKGWAAELIEKDLRLQVERAQRRLSRHLNKDANRVKRERQATRKAAKGEPAQLPDCSFCGKSQREVRTLIAGYSAFVCDECVEVCGQIIRGQTTEALEVSPSTPRPPGLPASE